ncbi:LPS export ABC transporter permease LptG [Falsihalocynthiibacter sp. S25ZX9]|uniref:LPS export ABC transporter permease LptG n=1 Tax=unclassified Falsihalocynthiibacter TaxID=2854191 RepID=UPI00350FC67E
MTLYFYLARKYLKAIFGVFSVFLGIAFLLDIAEQIRKFGNVDLGFSDLITLAALNTPSSMYAILPLVVVLATLALFLGLARSSELVVIRASGRSAIKSLISPVIVAFLFGVITVAVFNPIVAATKKQYEYVSRQFTTDQSSVMSISAEGLWLRQVDSENQTVIRAAGANLDGTELQQVTFLIFSQEGDPLTRIEAATAVLEDGYWALSGVKRWPLEGSTNPERDAILLEDFALESDLTVDKIRDSFGTPNAISIWDLPNYIDQLERAGFSALKHKAWLYRELAMPLMFVAMVMIGAGFTMRHTRFGRTGVMILAAILLAFSLFFLRDFLQIFGENGQLPIALATWSPPIVSIFIAMALLLHMEDG